MQKADLNKLTKDYKDIKSIEQHALKSNKDNPNAKESSSTISICLDDLTDAYQKLGKVIKANQKSNHISKKDKKIEQDAYDWLDILNNYLTDLDQDDSKIFDATDSNATMLESDAKNAKKAFLKTTSNSDIQDDIRSTMNSLIDECDAGDNMKDAYETISSDFDSIYDTIDRIYGKI